MAQAPMVTTRGHSPSASKPRKTATFSGDFAKRAAAWNLEQSYEQRPRKKRKHDKESTRLPIKTPEGRLQPSLLQEVPEDEEVASVEVSDKDESERDEEESKQPEPVSEVPLRQQILEAKEELARTAGHLNEDPEAHASLFKALNQYAEGKHMSVKKLCLGAQLAVYRDVIPGYRIRARTEQDPQERVSKEVRQQRHFEQALVAGYQTYIRDLAQLSKGRKSTSTEDVRSLASVAISCACALLQAVPHFNFRGELLKIVVNVLSSNQIDEDFLRCRETVETLFASDDDGKPSLEAVSILSKMMKARNYNINESVLNTFLHLRLLSEFASKGSQDRVDGPGDPKTKRFQRRQEKKAFHTKKERRLNKERKAVEKEMREADAVVSHEERDRLQAETLKLVFVAYFRILKARPPKLMGAVLEGLAKYAHLINQDFFGDLLEVLKDLIRDKMAEENDLDDDDESSGLTSGKAMDPSQEIRQTFLCITTAFALLQGQSVGLSSSQSKSAMQALNLDLGFFVTELYRSLHSVAMDVDIERSAKSLHLPEPRTPHGGGGGGAPHAAPSSSAAPAAHKINVQTTTVMLLRCLEAVLAPAHNARAVPPVRVAAFSKQLMGAALQLPERSCRSLLALMAKLTRLHGRKVAALWRTEEKKGDGLFDGRTTALEASNPFASTVWEGELLRRHFSPRVRDGVKAVEENVAAV